MSNRRRFLAIAAWWGAAPALASSTTTALALAAGPSAAPEAARASGHDAVSVWKGSAMGALASMTLVDPDRARARAAIARCVTEIERLESIFSLYRPGSALSRLNAAGELAAPPAELVELLSFALALARASGGAFDPSVQPLYRLHAEYFAAHPQSSEGPPAEALARVLRSVGFEAVELRADRIRLRRAGLALTLNGVAQGYMTDRIAALLRGAGFSNVLVDLGEALALGRRADGEPWQAAVADPLHAGGTLFELPLGDERGRLPALATSSGSGTRFGPATRLHHLLDPGTGTSAEHHASVTVAARRATLADGLSTALSLLPPARAEALLGQYAGARAWFVDAQGRVSARPTASGARQEALI